MTYVYSQSACWFLCAAICTPSQIGLRSFDAVVLPQQTKKAFGRIFSNAVANTIVEGVLSHD